MRRFVSALRLLTILPIPGSWGHAEEEMAGSVPFFPLVGLLIGASAAGLAVGLDGVFPPAVAGVLVVLWLMGVSGAFHLDGLSDTADGFLSAKPRERIMEIMKDSHVGVMGVAAVVGTLLVKTAALASLSPAWLWRGALLMPLAGRCAMVLEMCVLKSARPGSGLGSKFCGRRRAREAVWIVAFLAGAGWLAARWMGLALTGLTVVVALVFSWLCHRKIGGATGDTLGAVGELMEAATALLFAARPLEGWMAPS